MNPATVNFLTMLSKNLGSKKRASEDGNISRRESNLNVASPEVPHQSPGFAGLVHKTMKYPNKHPSSHNPMVVLE